MLRLLESLKGLFTDKQVNERSKGFSQVKRFINNAGNVGGVYVPISKIFPRSNAIRVDIVIITGQSFVP